MVKYLLMLAFHIVYQNVTPQESSRRFALIYTGCGYEPSAMEYQVGSDVFSIKFNGIFPSAFFI